MAAPQPGVWGIDLGQCALKAVRLENINGEVTATAFDYIEHPKILSQPDADPDELTREALQQFLSRNKTKGDVIVISVPGQSGLARFVKLPPVEEKKIADIVRFEAKQQIPFPLEEVVWDFQKIGSGEVTDGFAMETEIGLFAMKRDMVTRAITQFKDVSVEVHIIQMTPLALVNYVAYDLLNKDGMAGGPATEGSDSKECVVALDIGTDNSNLVITDGEKIIWQRPIPLGGNHFTRALTKDMKLTFAKAEHLKRNAVKSPDLKKILASLKTVLNDFVGEVQRSLGYFTNTHRDAQIQYMIGLGNAFRLPGLQKYLQEKLQLEVRKLTGLERVKGEDVLSAPTFTENILSFAVATGLALQGLKLSRLQTNLLPHEVRVERLVRAKKPWAAAAAAALLLAVAGMTFGYSMEFSTVRIEGELKKKMDQVSAATEKAGKQKAQLEAEKAAKAASEKAVLRIGAGVKERFNWQLLHQYINMALPRPNGDKLTRRSSKFEDVYKRYYLEKPMAKKAFEMLEEKRFASQAKADKLLDPAQLAKDEEFIKAHLIQVNIEGITALYTEDIPSFFKNVYKYSNLLAGMSPDEADIVRKVGKATSDADFQDVKDKIPPKAWVVEIRGYTYHEDEGKLVENTLLENLRRPEEIGNVPDEKGPAQGETKEEWKERLAQWQKMKTQVRDRMKFLVLFRNNRVENPEPGQFKFISKSNLKSLLRAGPGDTTGGDQKGATPMPPQPQAGDTGTAKASRDAWAPLGETARLGFGDANLGPAGGFGPGGGPGPGGGFDPKLGGATIQPNPPVIPGKGPTKEETIRRQPRTEFVLLFIWNEPLMDELAAGPAEGAPVGAPAVGTPVGMPPGGPPVAPVAPVTPTPKK